MMDHFGVRASSVWHTRGFGFCIRGMTRLWLRVIYFAYGGFEDEIFLVFFVEVLRIFGFGLLHVRTFIEPCHARVSDTYIIWKTAA